ncbi:TPA: hypothetical protein ACIS09_001667 [Salmonella enterica subsp. enterica serovar Birkenhead]
MKDEKDEKTKPVYSTVPFADSACTAWQFPDGEIIRDFIKADRKAKASGMELEQRKTGRFSPSH